jgi:subtilisin family serine protease
MMKKYVVLRSSAPADARVQPGLAGTRLFETLRHPTAQPEITVERLNDKELAQARAEPEVRLVAPTMPTRLIEPFKSAAPAAAADSWGIAAVGADKSRFTGAGVTVCVLDTGIDANHAAFKGVDLVTNDFSGDGIADVVGHGTHCAGTIFGRDDGKRIGIARGVEKALIGKVLGNDGSGSSEMLFNGMTWALQQNANIISMSLGFDFPGMVEQLTQGGMPVALATSQALEAYRGNLRMFDAIMAMLDAQGGLGTEPLVVAAAGNESRRDQNKDFRIAVSLPAAANDVVSVAAIGKRNDKLFVADFSNYMARISAPGVDITSAFPGGGFQTWSGTSMACPHVAGVAALWWEALQKDGLQADARTVAARLSATARRDVFPADIDGTDIGDGFLTAPE